MIDQIIINASGKFACVHNAGLNQTALQSYKAEKGFLNRGFLIREGGFNIFF